MKLKFFKNADPARKHMILRHDVDMTLASAANMAEAEADLGVTSIYFVLIRSDLYNPFSQVGTKHLKHILSLGHEIGLHFDASLYAQNNRDELDNHCALEASLLENLLEQSIGVVSFHRPAKVFQGWDATISGRLHTYHPRFFNEMAYCSDSRGGWFHGHPLELGAVKNGQALQLLTHPIWWDGTPEETALQRLDRLVGNQHASFKDDLAANCQPYADARSG